MKVLTTGLEWFTERPGGLPRYFADYTEHLVRSGDEVRALVGSTGTKKENIFPSYVKGVRVQGRAVAIRQSWHAAVARELVGSHYDVFNPHFAYYAWGAMNIPEMQDMPVVTHFHGPWAYESRIGGSGPKSTFRFIVQKAIERRVYRSSDRFIVLSDAFRTILIEHYNVPADRIHIVPGAVDVYRFKPILDTERVRHVLGLPQDRTILVSVRRLVKRMGLDNLIRAVDVLRNDFPDLLLVIIGSGQLEAELRQMIKERDLHNHVWMMGRVEDDDLPKYYQSANISIVPSVTLEGFGLITAESLACGTPVLGTPIGGTKEILSQFDDGLLLPGAEVNDLVRGIGYALTHPRSLPDVDVCRSYVVQNHTWDAAVHRIRQVFLTALSNGIVRQPSQVVSPTWSKEERL